MKKSKITRRKFIKNTIGAGIIITGSGFLPSCATSKGAYSPKGLPTVVLGKTGVRVPRIGVGFGSRFLENDEANALEIANYALDNGLYYWDTAHSYVNKKSGLISEEILGKIVKDRRKEIFLSTKISSRDPEEAKRQIELSLKRLQTDKLDMLKIHSIDSTEDVQNISKTGGLIDVVLQMKSEGVTRFIGFSGHSQAEAMKMMADRGYFDSMLMAMNHWGDNKEQRQEMVIPAAKKSNMGVVLMKVVRPKETVPNVQTEDLVRFGLSLDGADAVVLGMDSIKVIESNLQILRNFTAMNEDEKNKMVKLLKPFFEHSNLNWMKKGYVDGNWV